MSKIGIAPAPTEQSNPRAAWRGVTAVACAHCGLAVPPGLVDEAAVNQFCCSGCRTVYEVIHGCGMELFYRLRESAGDSAQPARVTNQRYAEYDDSAFASAYCRPCNVDHMLIDLVVEGVHCGACVWLIEKLPRIVPGVMEARLDLRRSRVRVVWDPRQARLSSIARALDSLGYPPHPARGAAAEELRRRDDRRFLIRLAIAGAATGNAMLLAYALYAGEFSGMEPAYATLLRWASALIGIVAVTWPGSVFFRGAWAALRTRTAHIDVPIALGLGVGAVWSLYKTAAGGADVYFDSLTMLVFLLLVARWIQRRQQRHAADAIELLLSLTPTRARRVRDGAVEEVAIESVQPGDIIEILAQECAPVDGLVIEGESLVDNSPLTGESNPVRLRSGDSMHSGDVSLSGRLLVRATAVGAETRVGRLMRLVEDSLGQKAPIVHLMDRIAGRFVVTVLALATATLAFWLWRDPAHAVDYTVALLIVACPCALGLATPLSLAVGLGRAARRGILIKGGAALEQLARPGTIVLDKTGTVTFGRMSLVHWHGPESLKRLVAALEQRASHPIARALCRDLQCADVPLASNAIQDARGGISGVVDGQRVMIGAPDFIRNRTTVHDSWVESFVAEAADHGWTPILIAVNESVCAAAALGDSIRPDAANCIRRLRSGGWNVHMLSGDHPRVVARIASELKIKPEHQQGGVTPEEKLRVVRELAVHGPVVMVGDGVNDAAALAAAHVGIAVHGGAEASFAAADVYLACEGLAPIGQLITAAGNTVRTIRRNLIVSLCYNATAVALAAAGLITPLIAAILMPISSVTVVSLSLSGRTFGDPPCR